jgi:hypothetical protein
VEREEGRLRIRVFEGFAARRLREKQRDLDALAARFFSRDTAVEVEEARPDANSARAAGGAPAEADAARQRRQDALNDPAVGRALDILGADIVEIRPLGGSGRS